MLLRLFDIPDDCLVLVLEYLQVRGICRLEVAAGGEGRSSLRRLFSLMELGSCGAVMSKCALLWLHNRNVKPIEVDLGEIIDLQSDDLMLIPSSSLRKLSLGGYDFVSDTLKTVEITSKWSQLTNLDIHGCNLTDDILNILSKSCPMLHKINLFACTEVTDRGLLQITKRCTQLEELNVSYCHKITDSGMKFLAGCPQMTVLCLNSCDTITDEGLSFLVNGCSNLTDLSLAGCTDISDAGIEHVSMLYNLTALDISECAISDDGIAHISSRCHNLRNLELHGCWLVSCHALKELSLGCTDIRILDFSGCHLFSDDGLGDINTLVCLHTLKISQCPEITSVGLSHLFKSCEALTHLDISSNSICDEDISTVAAAYPKLRSLSIGDTAVSDTGLYAMCKGCPHISELDISYCTEISNEGLVYLSERLFELVSLDLSGCMNVSDQGLLYLSEGCPLLSTIDVSDCGNVRGTCIKMLREKHPQLTITW